MVERLSKTDLLRRVKLDLVAINASPGVKRFLLKLWTDPGFCAIFKYRLSCYFLLRGGAGRFLSKILWKNLIKAHGCYLSPRSDIEGGLVLPHATGIVIGDGVRVGPRATIYQNVTIGRQNESAAFYPVIGAGVTIYAGACVVGAMTVGDAVVVAANAVVFRDVESDSVVGGVPARVLRKT